MSAIAFAIRGRPGFATILSFWCVLLSVSPGSANAAEIDRPNVILIVADDMGYADLGSQGATTFRTPNLDRLAAEGTRFTSFYVAQAVCTASRAAFLSGCYANRVGLAGALNHTSRNGIHPDEWLLPEMFKARGYATAGMGKWPLGTVASLGPLRNGFDEWLGIPYSNDNGDGSFRELISHEVASDTDGVRIHFAETAHVETGNAGVRREGEDRVVRGCHHAAPDCRPTRAGVPARDLHGRGAVHGGSEVPADVELWSRARLVVEGREAHDGVVQPAAQG